ncbi:MAG: 2-amino-4-hydroxy-6-hydroxymethyldihydropteridine diphosphokinase [Selenomonadaceae bacterium]|nr:2-amino-4-hydroxy-6-hydroxymethyldihydropteridine diphosphokinase [Selenomonadaceae bacterium]
MIAYLGLGANLGDRVKTLRTAIERIKKISGVELLRVSSFYETAAWGVTNQPDFINAAVKIKTTLEPIELLNAVQKIELELGRVRREHWAARTIDIDILLIDDLKINLPRLIVPHPYISARDFVKIPLAEISPCKFNLRGDRVEKIFGSPTDFELKLIACVDKNFGLGYKGKLLFRIAEDMKNFRALTLNNTVIYGRRTLATLPNCKPLDSRRNIIFSRSLENIEGAEIVHGVEDLWDALSRIDRSMDRWIDREFSKLFIIGGGEIFTELLPYATEIYFTVVDAEKISDVKFPPFADEFELVDVKHFDGKNFEIRKYVRIKNYG